MYKAISFGKSVVNSAVAKTTATGGIGVTLLDILPSGSTTVHDAAQIVVALVTIFKIIFHKRKKAKDNEAS